MGLIMVVMADIVGDKKHGADEGEFARGPGPEVSTGFLGPREAEDCYAFLDSFGNFDLVKRLGI